MGLIFLPSREGKVIGRRGQAGKQLQSFTVVGPQLPPVELLLNTGEGGAGGKEM